MHYEAMQVIDRRSLFLHMTDLNQQAETVLGPVRFRVDEPMRQLSVRSHGDREVSVDPFPFEEGFRTAITVRRIPNRSYETHENLRETLEEAEEETIEILIRPSAHSETP